MEFSQQKLNDFASKQWDKTLAFLQGHFSLSRPDCEDVFQESFIVLHQNILDGKLSDMTASLATYFNGICRNKAFELMRSKGKELLIVDEYPNSTKDDYILSGTILDVFDKISDKTENEFVEDFQDEDDLNNDNNDIFSDTPFESDELKDNELQPRA